MYRNFNSHVKLSVRLKLSDFIGTEKEEDVMNKISSIWDDLHFPFMLYLWYEEDKDISHDILKKFIKKWEGSLHYKTKIKPANTQTYNEFTWFNIVNSWDADPKHNFRFQYIYAENDVDDLLNGLEEFYKAAKFSISPKPPKKVQKRNDYEESRHSRQ